MKVLHIGLADHFTEGMLYQDNILTDINAKAGHDVTYIGDTYSFINGVLNKTDECDRILENGVRLIRIKFDYIINDFITKKIQKAKKLIKYLNEIKPDVILCHGLCGYELLDVAKYVKKNKKLLYIDTHACFENTAMTPVSKFAYRYIHGYFVKNALPVTKKILYIGYREKYFAQSMYNIPEEKMEYFPLGGIILGDIKQKIYRDEIIREMNYPINAIICAHSGKIDTIKKTDQVIKAFSNVKDDRLRLLIYGNIQSELKSEIMSLIDKDNRISFLGWQDSKGQERILGATDLYIQPGGASATAQVALCSGCALIVNREYTKSFRDCVFYAEKQEEIENILNDIVSKDSVLYEMKEKGYNIAKNELDYEVLANRYLK